MLSGMGTRPKELERVAEGSSNRTNAGRRHVRQETRVLPLDTEDGMVDLRLRGGGAFGFLVHGMADRCKFRAIPGECFWKRRDGCKTSVTGFLAGTFFSGAFSGATWYRMVGLIIVCRANGTCAAS